MVGAVYVLFLVGLCQAQVKDNNEISDHDLAAFLEEIFGKPKTSQEAGLGNSTESVASTTPKDAIAITVSQCRTADGGEGRCTMTSGCLKNLTPDRPRDKSTCEAYNEVCCGVNDISSSGGDMAASPNQKEGCGWRNIDNTRIMSDDDKTAFAEFPWITAVLTIVPENPEKPDGNKVYLYTCGGSVIHPQVVLTTAHNVLQEGISLRVRAGEWDTTSTMEALPYQDRNVERIIIHENYNRNRQNLFYDIALLVLERPLQIANNVNPICLPPAGQSAPDGASCFSAGWGKKKFDKVDSYQSILKKVQLPVIVHSKCQRELRKTRLGPLFKLHDTFMCAGGIRNQDTCTGDGGSPLMCPIEGQSDRYVASGMVAWGIGCGDTLPAVYTDVSTLRTWVDMKMQTLGFSTDFYTY